jgi:pyruvate formate lyase activating enzyme
VADEDVRPHKAHRTNVTMSMNLKQSSHVTPARYWSMSDDGRLKCELCPRFCHLNDGQRGVCFVRLRQGDQMVLTTYGRSTGFCVDPIEKKPLYHFYPGSAVLSFGTAGCNLKCKFCQNWDITTARETDSRAEDATPQMIAQAARRLGCRSVAFTYNDPVVFFEYAIDVARACHEVGVKTVAVTAGEICPEPRKEFFAGMDAANVDLKAFTSQFYKKLCGGDLDAVLDTLVYLKHQTRVWFELTTLVIPGENDSDAEIDAMTKWVVKELGADVPIHFSAFHPDFKMRDHPPTPPETLTRARQIALSNGIRYAYTGNVRDIAGGATFCHQCEAPVIQRDWFRLVAWGLDAEGRCRSCGAACGGHFDTRPGTWGDRRLPVRPADFV